MSDSKRELKKQLYRQRILNSASFLFAINGFSNTSIADIMHHANLGVGTFYNYFSSKDDLLLSLMKSFADELESQLYSSNSLSSLQLLESACSVVTNLIDKNKFILPLFLTASVHSDKPELFPISHHTPTFKPIFDLIIKRGQDDGEIRNDVPSSLIAEMFHSIYQAASFSKLDFSFQRNIELKVKILIEGIKLK